MKLSENERLLLVSEKEKISQISNEIIENLHTKPDEIYIINRMNKILSILSTIASYASSKSHNLWEFNKLSYILITSTGFKEKDPEEKWILLQPLIDVWCSVVNSIEFNFTENKAILNIPHIDVNLLKQSLSGIKTSIDVGN